MPDRLRRLDRARKNAAAARRRFLYGQFLKDAVDETGLQRVMTVTVPLFDHGLEWFRILHRTRKAKPGKREMLLAESQAKFQKDSRFPLEAIRKLEDGVRRHFAELEMSGELDWLPDLTLAEYEARLFAPSRQRGLRRQQRDEYRQKIGQYNLARHAAVEQVSQEAQTMLGGAGVSKERIEAYRRVVIDCCLATLDAEPGSAEERTLIDTLVCRSNLARSGLDPKLAQRLAATASQRLRELARSLPPDPRPKR